MRKLKLNVLREIYFKNIPVFNAWLDPFSREKMGWVFHNSSQNSNNQNTPKLLLIKNFNITCIHLKFMNLFGTNRCSESSCELIREFV